MVKSDVLLIYTPAFALEMIGEIVGTSILKLSSWTFRPRCCSLLVMGEFTELKVAPKVRTGVISDTSRTRRSTWNVAHGVCPKIQEAGGDDIHGDLTRLRMLLAGDRLKSSDDSVSALSLSLGYETESAFGRAFRRFWGCSPREHRRPQAQALSALSTSAGE
jgi:AraC-like DNA-binding protein